MGTEWMPVTSHSPDRPYSKTPARRHRTQTPIFQLTAPSSIHSNSRAICQKEPSCFCSARTMHLYSTTSLKETLNRTQSQPQPGKRFKTVSPHFKKNTPPSFPLKPPGGVHFFSLLQRQASPSMATAYESPLSSSKHTHTHT